MNQDIIFCNRRYHGTSCTSFCFFSFCKIELTLIKVSPSHHCPASVYWRLTAAFWRMLLVLSHYRVKSDPLVNFKIIYQSTHSDEASELVHRLSYFTITCDVAKVRKWRHKLFPKPYLYYLLGVDLTPKRRGRLAWN